MTLASSERELEHSEPVELAALAGDALACAGDAVARRGLHVERALEPAASVGDAVLISRLVANLIDNAVAHNVDAGWMAVRTGAENGDAVISVANGGYPITPSEVARLFEPFQRLEGRASSVNSGGHHGLGLSIVRRDRDDPRRRGRCGGSRRRRAGGDGAAARRVARGGAARRDGVELEIDHGSIGRERDPRLASEALGERVQLVVHARGLVVEQVGRACARGAREPDNVIGDRVPELGLVRLLRKQLRVVDQHVGVAG